MFKGVDHVVVAAGYRGRRQPLRDHLWDERHDARRRGGDQHEDGLLPVRRYLHSVGVQQRREGPDAIWVNERGESVWIVAMRVDDITGAVAELRDKGVSFIGDPGPGVPAKGSECSSTPPKPA